MTRSSEVEGCSFLLHILHAHKFIENYSGCERIECHYFDTISYTLQLAVLGMANKLSHNGRSKSLKKRNQVSNFNEMKIVS
jgi:hypothetical protein